MAHPTSTTLTPAHVSWSRSLGAGLLCLVVIAACHSPRWWLLTSPHPGSFEWERAASYLKQCDAPFRSDIEPAMRWRFMPQAIVYLVGGGHALALAFPWIGVWAYLSF